MDALWPNASIGCGLNQDQGQYTVQIVTDNDSLCFVIPHSDTKKYEYTAKNQWAHNDVMHNNDVYIIRVGSS